jgi:hypothetical protein
LQQKLSRMDLLQSELSPEVGIGERIEQLGMNLN